MVSIFFIEIIKAGWIEVLCKAVLMIVGTAFFLSFLRVVWLLD